MSAEQVFSIVNLTALAGWIALAALPSRAFIVDILCRFLLPGGFGVIYVAILAAKWGESSGGFGSLAEVAALFTNPWLLLAGWIHYLAFDLFIGSWQVRDARDRGLPHLLVLPCLVFTFLFGPAGLLLYLSMRTARSRRRALL